MKIERILCPIGFSDSDAAINQFASLLANSTGARITYLHVLQSDVPYMQYEYLDIDRQTDDALQRLQHIEPTVAGLKIQHRVEFGPPARKILEHVADKKIDLIVLGTHGRSGFSRLLTGSVAEAVIRKSTCPVLAIKSQFSSDESENAVVSQHAKNATTNIACAIDVNDYDQEVVDFAASLARRSHVRLDLIHVTIFPDSESPLKHGYFGSAHTLINENRKFQEVRTSVPDVQLNYYHLSGLPSEQILVFADQHEPQFLVLGTHGRRGLASVFGSVATGVLRQANCPVIVLRQGQQLDEPNDEYRSAGSTQQSIESAAGPITNCICNDTPSIDNDAKVVR